MAVDLLRQRDPGRHQESRPIDGVEADDVLADQMDVGRPVALPQLRIVRIAEAGDVVGQRIEPDVHHMIGAARHRHAPVEAGARDAEVVEPALDEAQHLVAAALGRMKSGLAA